MNDWLVGAALTSLGYHLIDSRKMAVYFLRKMAVEKKSFVKIGHPSIIYLQFGHWFWSFWSLVFNFGHR